ncbi:MAG: hypothetical protein KBG38_08105 [Candidatus Cloacimonas sp.]|jgi:hypothetical protein|nr:hypothetical protein [Candidatus Cloacimonas sp.]
MATRKPKNKKTEELVPEIKEVPFEDLSAIDNIVAEESEPVASVELQQEEQPDVESVPYIPLKQVKLLRDIGNLKSGSVVDIIRTENDRLFFKMGDTEMYFDPTEVNRLYVVIQ